jgi:hypothetical protein
VDLSVSPSRTGGREMGMRGSSEPGSLDFLKPVVYNGVRRPSFAGSEDRISEFPGDRTTPGAFGVPTLKLGRRCSG